jgi:asparagine synthase (glutamine-hydrolysing)
MCGITALIPVGHLPGISSHIRKMSDLIRHRGPDDEGYVIFPVNPGNGEFRIFGGPDTPAGINRCNLPYCPHDPSTDNADIHDHIAFGHRRLSIIDLSPAGHQPMSYQNDRFWIIYNGEIYNYLEIRDELIIKGYEFVSHSDTEVILAAYIEWGKDCLNHFNGMWSFLIYDMAEQVLFGSRDRFGIKPFYYWFSPKGFLAVASEIKAFTVLPGWNPQVNAQRAYDFLVHGLGDHTSETMFAGVFQLQAGQAFEITVSELGDALPVYQWYTVPDVKCTGSEREAIETFRTVLGNAVRIHLRSDVPVGSCLSGGLDSTSIVSIIHAFLAGQKDAHQTTFSAYSTDPRWDEREFIETVLQEKKINGFFCYPEVYNLFNALPDMIWHQDEPFRSTSIYAQWAVMELVRTHDIKVILDGQGSDEIIAGYHPFLCINQADLLLRFHWIRLVREILAARRRHHIPVPLQVRDIGYYLCEITDPGRFLLKKKNREKLSPSWLNNKKLRAVPSLPPKIQRRRGQDNVTAYCEMATFSTILPFLLHYEDRNSMAHSIESRVPFLDVRFVEFLLNIPPRFKIRDGVTKRILRQAMDGIIPDRIRDRMDKLGFATPEEVWMTTESSTLFRNSLEEAVASSDGILTPETLDLFDDMVAGKTPFNEAIWRMIIFGKWMNLFSLKAENREN